jgi:hypothetical protein
MELLTWIPTDRCGRCGAPITRHFGRRGVFTGCPPDAFRIRRPCAYELCTETVISNAALWLCELHDRIPPHRVLT